MKLQRVVLALAFGAGGALMGGATTSAGAGTTTPDEATYATDAGGWNVAGSRCR